ncbi:Sensors of blue-light using FAD [Rhizobium sp. NFR07]|jgi:hypothetical protein|uniref:BLUF domain-containing protein n=1 Tax=Rhizobium sp. NFR07 TaxID=1566262 RepID=UPI0008DF77C1|nr:BLUF domain-containing protein [Rhizobium sp. NFR07]SFB64637.1 Sensors of blue-light using FAD [Rhizobium sp. NFR07]
MKNSMFRLAYYSHNHLPDDAATFAVSIQELLEKSRANNLRDGITGALLFNKGCFAQVLEGSLDKVEAAFERIQQDERHGDVSLLALDPIEQRSFPNWAMGFIGKSQKCAERFSTIGTLSGFDPTALNGGEIQSLLRDLALEEETAYQS